MIGLSLLTYILLLLNLARQQVAVGSISQPAAIQQQQQPAANQTEAPNYLKTGRQITGILDRFMSLGYDKRVRPNYGGPPVEVNVTMRILSISSVSEVMMDFTADFYFRQTWHDPRLSFKKLGDIQTLYVGAEVSKKIWLPDTFFGNEKLAYFHEATTPNVFLRIDHSGEVYRSIRLTVTSSCPMNLQYFPMDRQRCTIEAESYGYNVKDIIYRWARKETAVERDKEISLPQFDIVKTVQKYRLEELSSGTYSRLIAEIHFARRMGYYLIQIYIPSSLIVVISWVSFWLHRNASPARVQLGVTTVLTMTTLMSSTNAALPKISYVKSIDIFLGTCFIMVFAALLEYATVGYLGKRIAMRKAQVQHAQSQAQARVFAQLQSQGAQGDPVPPLASSALLPSETSAGNGSLLHQQSPAFLAAAAGTCLSPAQQAAMMHQLMAAQQQHQHQHQHPHQHQHQHQPAGYTTCESQAAPEAPERSHRYHHHCHQSSSHHSSQHHISSCASAICHLHRAATALTTCHCGHQAPPSPMAGSHLGLAHGNAYSGRQGTCHCHCQQQQPPLSSGSHTLPRNLTFAGSTHESNNGATNGHAAAPATVTDKLNPMQVNFSPNNNFRGPEFETAGERVDGHHTLPSYFANKGRPSAAATAAAATFVNMHRRNKGLPPSSNPNFAQFAWMGQNWSIETIFGIRPSDIDKYSRVVFPVCFVCFQLMYWIVYLHISAFLEPEQQQTVT